MWDTMVHIWRTQIKAINVTHSFCFVIPDAFLLGFGSEGYRRKHLIIYSHSLIKDVERHTCCETMVQLASTIIELIILDINLSDRECTAVA